MVKLTLENDGNRQTEAVLHAYGPIGYVDWDGNGVMESDVIALLDDVPKDVDELTVRINSDGGVAFAGVAIHNILVDSRFKVKTVVDGLAASAASVIQLAGNVREMGRGSMIMIHEPMAMAWGDAAYMREQADRLDSVGETIAELYADVTGRSVERMRQLMMEETWMSRQDAEDMNFATRTGNAEADSSIAARFDTAVYCHLQHYKRVPKSLRSQHVNRPNRYEEATTTSSFSTSSISALSSSASSSGGLSHSSSSSSAIITPNRSKAIERELRLQRARLNVK